MRDFGRWYRRNKESLCFSPMFSCIRPVGCSLGYSEHINYRYGYVEKQNWTKTLARTQPDGQLQLPQPALFLSTSNSQRKRQAHVCSVFFHTTDRMVLLLAQVVGKPIHVMNGWYDMCEGMCSLFWAWVGPKPGTGGHVGTHVYHMYVVEKFWSVSLKFGSHFACVISRCAGTNRLPCWSWFPPKWKKLPLASCGLVYFVDDHQQLNNSSFTYQLDCNWKRL